MSATETPTTTTSAPTLDVELVPAPAPHPSAAIVDAWFLETFHGLLLSAPTASSRSITVIDQSGSSRRSNAPRVALMMPAPTSTTSTRVVPTSDTGSLVLSLVLRRSQVIPCDVTGPTCASDPSKSYKLAS